MAAERRKDHKNRVLREGEYEKSNGTYEFKWRDKRGNRHSSYAKTLDELREKEKELQKDILNGKKVIDKKMTINDFYDRWVQLKRGLKNNTFRNYCYMYEQYVKNGFGETRIQLVKKTDIRAFYNRLHDSMSLKVSTIDSVHTVLHQVLELAVEDGYMFKNPSDNALKELWKAHNREVKKRKALTAPEQKVFEDFLAESEMYHHWQPAFVTLLYTGMRVGELCGLRWCDVDFEENFISINHTLVYFDRGRKGSPNCGFMINTTKTAAGFRTIPMLPIVREALLQERKYQFDNGIVSEAIVDGYNDFIFVNRFGNVQHQGTLNKALKRIIRDCNYQQIEKKGLTLPPFSCHILRHSFTTRLCEANVNIKVIQDILGHSDAATTLQIYADATKEMKNQQMTSLNKYFSSLYTAWENKDNPDGN